MSNSGIEIFHNKIYDKTKILIVEDSKTLNKIMHAELNYLDYDCTSAYTLQEAKECISKVLYDFIILDMHLPDGEGKDLLITVSSLSKSKIIVLSSTADNHLREDLFDCGILDYLQKDKNIQNNIKDIDKVINNIQNNILSSILILRNCSCENHKIANILKSKNYNIYESDNTIGAYDLIVNKKVDLVIFDLDIPSSKELMFLEKIKDSISEDLPVLVFTNSLDTYIHRTFIKSGASDFIKKPFISEELLLKTDQNIKYYKKNKELFLSKKILNEYKECVDIFAIVSKTDVDGYITYVNKEFERISGYKEHELIGKTHNILRHESIDISLYSTMWKTIKEDKKPWFGILANKNKQGEEYFVNTVINPILDQDGNILEYIAIRYDVTELETRKKYYKTKFDITSEKYEEIMSLSKLYEFAMEKSNIILRTDLQKRISYVNESFCKISGYNKEELIGKEYSFLKHPDVKEEDIASMWKTLEAGEIWKGTVKSISKNNKAYFSLSTAVPIKNKDGKILEYMGIRQDVTEMVTLHEELENSQREIIYKMGEIGETRSRETGKHVERVAKYSKLLALKAGMSLEEAEILGHASPMHDIGKVGIPDSILNKPGKLTNEEFELMKEHCKIGYEMLKNSQRPILKASAIVAYEHHEKYNGLGYPQGLKGEEIHIYGRITAVCDVFDALGSERVYKKAWPLEKILELFKKEKAEHFDPVLIDLFFDNLDEFLEIQKTIGE